MSMKNRLYETFLENYFFKNKNLNKFFFFFRCAVVAKYSSVEAKPGHTIGILGCNKGAFTFYFRYF